MFVVVYVIVKYIFLGGTCVNFELVKNPEVTLCGWWGYKPSINNNNNDNNNPSYGVWTLSSDFALHNYLIGDTAQIILVVKGTSHVLHIDDRQDLENSQQVLNKSGSAWSNNLFEYLTCSWCVCDAETECYMGRL